MRRDGEAWQGELEKALRAYTGKGLYPLHMPGHKRNFPYASVLPYELDLTELPETDDLHEAGGILRAAMERTAALYGAERSWYLVNGSSCGNLAGIFAMTGPGDELIAARNCHRSVLHAMQLRNLHVHWILPEELPGFDICGSVLPERVEEALQKFPASRAVILTSPTYEGVCSDIQRIAALCHSHGIPLMVDEAHGAHFGLEKKGEGFFPDSAIQLGADLVVQSPHKTLPALTQTAWLHWNSGYISERSIQRQLSVFESSSPSYPLLSSLDACTELLLCEREALFGKWREGILGFEEKTKGLRFLKRLSMPEAEAEAEQAVFALDRGKLLLSCRNSSWDGASLRSALRERFGFELEMSMEDSCLAMTSLCDRREALERFAEAVCRLDKEGEARKHEKGTGAALPLLRRMPELLLTLGEAVECEHAEMEISAAEGRICGEYIYCYPPGIPLLLPGEIISRELCGMLREFASGGQRLHFSESGENLDKLMVCRVK